MTVPALEIEGLTVRYGTRLATWGIDLRLGPGEVLGLVGESGAGKSTTINLICRFYEPDAGRMLIDGIDYREIALQDMREQIGIVSVLIAREKVKPQVTVLEA